MNTPVFSIIMPVWNRADSIAPAIQSVLAQTFRDYELLIIDDGSEDELEQTVQPFLSDSVLFFRRTHNGVSAARNFGLEQARGSCVAYLDSDNTWHPGFLAAMHKALRASPQHQAAYCKYNRFKKDENGSRYLDAVMGKPFDFKKLVAGNTIDLNSFVHTKSALGENIRFDESLKRLNDWDFILKVTEHNAPVFIKDVLVDYNCNVADTTISAREDFFEPMIRIRQRHAHHDSRIVEINHDGILYCFENLPDKKYYNYLITSYQGQWNTRDFTAPGFPYMLQIEPTNCCNLSCTVCPAAANKNDLNRDRRHLRLEEFKKIVDDMNDYLLFLVMWEWGEPFLNPELPDMLRYASERGIKTVTSTNAHFLHDTGYLERILTSGLSTLIIAIDSLEINSYGVYRQDGNLKRALAGLNNVVTLKKKLNSPTRINLRMVLMKSNEHERNAIRTFARRQGVDIFTVKTAFTCIGPDFNDEPIVPNDPALRRYAYKPGTFERIRLGGPCTKPWFMFNIHSNGNVVACNYDYNQEMIIGNAFDRPVTEIWNSEACRDLRKKLFYDKDTLPKCRECDINFKLSPAGWFVEVTDFSISTLQRFARATRRTARENLPPRLFSLFDSAYRTVDTTALNLKKLLSSARSTQRLHSSVHPLHLPISASDAQDWSSCHIFDGAAKSANFLSCHVSRLAQSCCPHPEHTHPEEEILLLLSGQVDCIVQPEVGSQKSARIRLQPFHGLYYPRGFAHTLQTLSSEPAHYLMLKWQRKRSRHAPPLACGPYALGACSSDRQVGDGMRRRLVFEGATGYLKKLHCHVSTLEPLAGYAPHADSYDVIIVVLEGEIETLGRRVGAHSVIFYAAGEPHGLRNPDTSLAAHYVVFELHAD
jgi:radical SAM protein with 4Fe4S-binding SPASM domain